MGSSLLVPCYGVYDFTARPHQLSPSCRTLLELAIFKATCRARPAIFEEASPVLRIGAEAPPFFVLHGENDTLVPVEIARRFMARLLSRLTSGGCYAAFGSIIETIVP